MFKNCTSFLNKMQEEYSSALSESPFTKAWTDLAKVCLMQTILFNRHREGGVASMPLHAFLTRDRTDPHQDLNGPCLRSKTSSADVSHELSPEENEVDGVNSADPKNALCTGAFC